MSEREAADAGRSLEPSRARARALGRLRWRRPTRIPFIAQLQSADCGAACLAMVCGFHGRHLSLLEVRESIGVGTRGLTASALLAGAAELGLRARGLRIEPEQLHALPRASLLHWGFNHWVVFDGVSARGVDLVDPRGGRKRVSHEQFSRMFTGVALELAPSEAFEPAPRSRSLTRAYLGLLLADRQAISRTLVTSVLLRALALALPLALGAIIDTVVPRGELATLGVLALGLGCVIVFTALLSLIRGHLLVALQTGADARFTLGLMERLVALPYDFFQQRATGDLLMRINSTAEIRGILTSTVLAAVLDGAFVLIYLAAISTLDPRMAALVIGLGLLDLIVYLAFRRAWRDNQGELLEARAESQKGLVELVSGIETLKMAGAEGAALERWSHKFVDELHAGLRRGRLELLNRALSQGLSTAGPIIVVLVGAAIVLSGSLSLGELVAINALAVAFLAPLRSLIAAALDLERLHSYVARLEDIVTSEPERRGGRHVGELRGGVELRGVSFRYAKGEALILDALDLRIEPGESVAIVGPSGSGKTTLAMLLVGLYQPTSGTIAFDGHPLSDISLSSLRRQVAIVPQSPYVFHGSVRDNIALTRPDASQAEIVEAARLAGLHQRVLMMPMGYDTLLGDRGVALSGGERQRIALARAFTTRAPLLLLDEATSDLDALTERRIVEHIDALRCTRVTIAHRLGTIRGADRILVLEGGRVIEQGKHAQLLALGGRYAQMVAAQTGTERGAKPGGA